MPPGNMKEDALGKLGGPEFREAAERLGERKDGDGKSPKLTELEVLVKKAGGSDIIRVVSILDERIRKSVNEKLAEAMAWREGRMPPGYASKSGVTPGSLEEEAQTMLSDRGNYIVSQVVLVRGSENTRTDKLNLAFVSANVYTEEKGEFASAKLVFDASLAREVHDSMSYAGG